MYTYISKSVIDKVGIKNGLTFQSRFEDKIIKDEELLKFEDDGYGVTGKLFQVMYYSFLTYGGLYVMLKNSKTNKLHFGITSELLISDDIDKIHNHLMNDYDHMGSGTIRPQIYGYILDDNKLIILTEYILPNLVVGTLDLEIYSTTRGLLNHYYTDLDELSKYIVDGLYPNKVNERKTNLNGDNHERN